MSLWDWLFGSKKDANGGFAHVAPPSERVPQAQAQPPAMQQLQVHAPAAVPTSYGIQRAIELMRALPIDDDPALVLRVVRKTLRSTGVSLEEIVVTAKARETAIIKGIENDRSTIEQLELQIATRKANITRLEGDLEETRSVRGRIEEALETETKVGSITPEQIMQIRADAAQSLASKPPPLPKPEAPPTPSTSSTASNEPSAAKPGASVPVPRKPPIVASKPPPKLPSALSQSPSAAKPAEAKPADAKPPADAKAPADAKPPADADPADAKPADVKIESKPAIDSPSDEALRGNMSSIPDLGEIDDAFDEPTAKVEIDAKAATKTADRDDRNK